MLTAAGSPLIYKFNLVDNFDYCLTRKTAEVLTTLLRQKHTKLIAEIHNEEVIDWLDLSNKSIVEIKL
jgi:Mg/Co/Ni transporter MgtE